MKRLILLAVAVIVMCSCSVMTHQRYVSTMFLDFQPYTESGFFISPNPYTGQFEPVGEISIYVQPALQRPAKQIKGSYEDGLYVPNNASVVQESISSAELLEMAVKEARDKGADGISNFKCVRISDVSEIEPYHYEISGFAIKILDR